MKSPDPVPRTQPYSNPFRQVAQRQDPGCRVAEQLGDPVAVIPALAGPIQRVAAEAMDVFHARHRDVTRPGVWVRSGMLAAAAAIRGDFVTARALAAASFSLIFASTA